jgi:hypothetical protein
LEYRAKTASYPVSSSDIYLKNARLISGCQMLIGISDRVIGAARKDLGKNMNTAVLGRIIVSVPCNHFQVKAWLLGKKITYADEQQDKKQIIW